jgi:translation initiation factor 3 subunit C
MYNRAMVQLGICAFRHESIQDSHNCLADLLMSARVKELLAQGLMPQHRHDRSAEQEKVERSRQVLITDPDLSAV